MGRSGNLLIITQFIFLVISILIIANLLEKLINKKYINIYWLFIFISSISSQIYFQYSSLVLQQSLFTLFLSLYCLLTYLSLKNRKFFFLFIPLIFITNNTSIIFYYFNYLYIIFIIFTFLINKVKFSKQIILIFMSFFVLNLTSTYFWNSYKDNILKSTTIPSEIQNQFLHTSGKTNFVVGPQISRDYLFRLLSLESVNSLKNMTYSGKDKSENYYFLGLLLDNTFTCGGNVASEAVYYRNYSQFYFDYSCKNTSLRDQIHKKLQDYYFYFYSFIVIFYFLFVIYNLKSKAFYIFIFTPLLFCLLYVITFGQVDRYFIPIYPFVIASFCFSVVKVIEKSYLKN